MNYLQEKKVKSIISKYENIPQKDVKIVDQLFGGMSNKTYIAKGNNLYSVHITDEDGLIFVNRDYELDALSKLKDNPYIQKDVYVIKDDKRYRIFKYVEGSSLNELDYIKYIKKIASSLKSLHQSSLFNHNYNPFDYLEYLEKRVNLELSDYFYEAKELLNSYRVFLTNRKLYPCHNDYQPSNLILDKNNDVIIVDLEFAANNDFTYDIATFGNLDFNSSLLLLKEYSPSYTYEDLKSLYLWRIFIDLQWYLIALWKKELGFDEKLKLSFNDIAIYFLNQSKPLYESVINDNLKH